MELRHRLRLEEQKRPRRSLQKLATVEEVLESDKGCGATKDGIKDGLATGSRKSQENYKAFMTTDANSVHTILLGVTTRCQKQKMNADLDEIARQLLLGGSWSKSNADFCFLKAF